MNQIKSRTTLSLQTDGALFADTLVRGLYSVSSLKESSVIVDLRNSKSGILWSLYGRNIKFIDDIINIISDINISVFRTYTDKNTAFCVKERKIFKNEKFKYFFEFLKSVYSDIYIISDDVSSDGLASLVNYSDIILLPVSDNPVSFENISGIFSEISAYADKNIYAVPAVFNTGINYVYDGCTYENTVFGNIVSIPFSFDIQKEILNKNFVFNDVKNVFVDSVLKLNKIISLCTHNEKKEISSIYEKPESYISLKERLHKDLIKHINDSDCKNQEEIKNIIRIYTEKLLGNYDIVLPYGLKQKIFKELCDDIAGLGVLEDFINNNEISEIMVNGTDKIYVEQKGKIIQTDISFQSNDRLKTVIDRIAMSVGRHIDDASPIVDARLKDGSRVNAVISPVSLNGHILTIRKFSKHRLTSDDLISYGSISDEMTDFLKTAVKNRKNILISGGTGTGKTTLLNIISSFINNDERIITIEDSAELQLNQEHVIRLETRPKSIEGTSEITIRQLVKNALRMRPDRIIVGECRSGETLDMLQAMNTGHSGSMTTVHANSPEDAVSRLLVMSLMSGIELPERAIISMIISALDIIIQIKRFEDGSRKIKEISVIKKFSDTEFDLIPLFQYDEDIKQFKKKTEFAL